MVNKAAQALGRRGGKATAKARTKQERSDSARQAAKTRWARIKAKREANEENAQ